MFSRLYVVMEHQDADMETFCKHENHPYPSSLSEREEL